MLEHQLDVYPKCETTAPGSWKHEHHFDPKPKPPKLYRMRRSGKLVSKKKLEYHFIKMVAKPKGQGVGHGKADGVSKGGVKKAQMDIVASITIPQVWALNLLVFIVLVMGRG